jgi:hypothetical protein
MPTPALCSRCQSLLPARPVGGVCPACGSKLPIDTPPAEATRRTDVPAFDPHHAPTATAPDPAQLPTKADDGAGPPPPADVPPPPALPDYDGLTLLGYGGMGVVYRAVHRRTGKPAAVKFLHAAGSLDPDQRARFRTETLALARARHPGVVEVADFGEANGRPYLAMEYVPGPTLAQRLRTDPPTARRAAEIVAAVAAAVAAAHAVKVLHRDLKPGNVLLAPDDTPRVTDFGLAKLADRNDRMTVTGHVLGTPAYMAPEQALGRPAAIDERTDVFGLGATLYELLCGRPPFKADSQAESIQLALAGDVTLPGKYRPGVPAELEAVCQKCLAKDPARRYQTAQEVADELTRWLAGEPTRERPPTRLQKAGRWARRHRLKLVGAAVPLALLAAIPLAREPATDPPAGAAVPLPKPDPWEVMRATLAAGKPATLVPATGPPECYDWFLGDAPVAESLVGDRTCGFQTLSSSMLVLARDPVAESYRFSTDIRHVRAMDDTSVVGVFLGMDEVPAPGTNLQLTRWIVFEFSDYWRQLQFQFPQLKKDHAIEASDVLGVRRPGGLDLPRIGFGGFTFTPASKLDGVWRRIEADVSPEGIRLSWQADDGTMVPAFWLTADRIGRHIAGFNGDAHRPTLGDARVPDWRWNPRRPLGIYAHASAVAFRNAVLEPRPTP